MLDTPFGSYQYRHLHRRLFFGYRPAFVGGNATVFLAEPEKALLDLIHLTPRGDTTAFLEELGLENMESWQNQSPAQSGHGSF